MMTVGAGRGSETAAAFRPRALCLAVLALLLGPASFVEAATRYSRGQAVVSATEPAGV